MPSDTLDDDPFLPLTARCYCGAVRLVASDRPVTAAYCHCAECRRWTGALVAAFAAFGDAALHAPNGMGTHVGIAQGVDRWFCTTCGSSIAARFAYLPGQTYVPIGLLDAPDRVAPRLHAHANEAISWLHLNDDLPRIEGSARAALNAGGATP